MVAKAFKRGLDGLMVVGCHFGECHYVSGNVEAKAKIEVTRRLFRHLGVNEDRIAFRQCSSSEASVFVKLVNEFDELIKTLGPLGGDGDRLKAPEIFKRLETAESVLAGEKIRWLLGKRTPFLDSGNRYGEVFTEHEFNRAIDMIIVEETEVQKILTKLGEDNQSVKDLAMALEIPSERVFRHITALRRKNFVVVDKVSGRSPIYQLVPQQVQSGR
jgi:biotin operon repressor